MQIYEWQSSTLYCSYIQKKAFRTLLFYQKIRSQKYFAKKRAFALYFNVLVILVFYYLEFKLRLKMLNVLEIDVWSYFSENVPNEKKTLV